MHLDPATYERLLAGTLPSGEARALAAHLAGECEICERFLALRRPADALDGLGEAALDRAFPASPVPGEELEFARIDRRLRAARAWRPRALAVGALAASLVVAGVAGLLARSPRPPPDATAWDGVKGTELRGPRVLLRVLRLPPGGEPLRGHSGESAERGERLLFEVEADRDVNAALIHVAEDGAAELLWRDRIRAGQTVLGAGGKAAAFALADLAGRQRFVLVASSAPLDPAQAVTLARQGALPEGGGGAGTTSTDTFEVTVR